jgi:hypothetical protein
MLSKSQKALIKTAQREAELPDEDYRDLLETVTGSRTSTDPKLGDRSFDKIMAFLEAVFWRKFDLGQLQRRSDYPVFQERRYWSKKNTMAETSRERYSKNALTHEIAELERAMGELGFGENYCGAIRERVDTGRSEIAALYAYRNALRKTLNSKQRRIQPGALTIHG